MGLKRAYLVAGGKYHDIDFARCELLKLLGEFEDVTRMVHCIVDSNFTTGAKFFVNGGQYMH